MVDPAQHFLPLSGPEEIGTSIELFTGGGGLALAMHRAGFRHLAAVEIDKRACATLRENRAVEYDPAHEQAAGIHSEWPLIEGDIKQVSFDHWRDKVDIVAGGVPCQPWSLGGAHKGYDDPRNLWPELFRVVRETRPLAVVAENVKGLLRPSFKPYYEYIINELKAPFEERLSGDSGVDSREDWEHHNKRLVKALTEDTIPADQRYDVKYKLVNAADYGVPQIRWRVFVVAFRRDLGLADWEFPEPTHSEAALLRAKADGSYWDEHKVAKDKREKPDVDLDPGDDRTKRWRTLRDAIQGDGTAALPRLKPPKGFKVENEPHIHHVGWPGAREYPGHTANELDRPAKTIKAGVHGVPGGESVMRTTDGSIRYMTVREAARVMTFPDDWRLAGPRGEQMRQLGNAVPVLLGEAIARSVAEALRPHLGRKPE
ncbi:DNA (cytosine-5-)-methyltransferase [Saccharothrix violaceirubra]|uniref:DNA (cytosine-5-)-methyltransferase n=1 Tax=Saccharothrix violaceirubra TaxID=413306 RepID=A0A7W7T9Y2_9PSEU|nr:DNA cytosine methyltransferase [Saccharothrix violaceirubra]MBB4969220.1 DNA (cytosine-5)-methyltransferase 1 [Saccharothrix violaceirubra]